MGLDMKRRAFLGVLGGAVVARPLAAWAQQRSDKISVGFLSVNVRPAMKARVEAFQQGLRELRYVDGQNVLIEYRFAEGNPERLRGLADELVRLKVDVIVTEGTTATRFAKEATATIPIVMAQDPDPVGSGFVASLARPGGNITGLSTLAPELSGKQLELLKEAMPGMTRVAVLWNAANPANAAVWQETQAAARALGLLLHAQAVQSPQDLEGAFALMAQAHPDALLVLQDSLITMRRPQIVEFVTQQHLPSVFGSREWVVAGGLMSYGPSIPDLFRRAATYMDKILKGTKPADLPVEQPIKFELVINLKTAKALGLTIPPTVLFQADEVMQ